MTELPVHTTPDDAHAHPHKTGHGPLDLILALSAIFISAVSLAVAIEHGRTERDLVAANSWPFVQQLLSNEYGDDRKAIALGVSNDGVGPAKIKSLEVFLDRRPVSSSRDLLRRCCGYRPDASGVRLAHRLETSLVDDTVLRAGRDNPVMVLHRDALAPDMPERFAKALFRISFHACYCSILDQCWTSDIRTTRTAEVKECPKPEHPFDPNGS